MTVWGRIAIDSGALFPNLRACGSLNTEPFSIIHTRKPFMHPLRLCVSFALALLMFGTPPAVAQDATPAAEPPAFKEQLVIPPGTPEEMLAFFQKLKQQRPKLETEEQVRAHFQRIY